MIASAHPTDELPALLHGELRVDELRAVTTHLRTCASCQRELVEIAAGFGALARVHRQGLADDALPALPPLAELPDDEPEPVLVRDEIADDTRQPRARRPRWLVPVAAAVVALVVAAGGFLVLRNDSSTSAPAAQVALRPVGDQAAGGRVEMRGSGASRTMVVSTDLPPAAHDHYYEVWLLDTRTNGMVAVGVLPSGGRATFTLPGDLLSRYDAVDLSLQPDNGNPAHSDQSVLRARYA